MVVVRRMQKAILDYLDEGEARIIRDTSRDAYRDLMCHPFEVNGRYQIYLQALHEIGHPATDQEVTKYIGKKDPNYIRPRRNELAYNGNNPRKKRFPQPLICEGPKRRCKITEKIVHTWWFTEFGLMTVKTWGVTS